MTTMTERAEHVRQANANQALEGLKPDAQDLEIQAKYIEGTASLDDLLRHANNFATQVRKGDPS
ncbi:antitoxin VbhA family protein [Rhodoferax sp. GW822-FHT02A01]|uniref:antitoxin VbhA family protein n=1 Tax=Rhodoferax sp. GW822-FHT02A01 TaxID=3141537 RepID=UPI00315D7F0D